MPASLTEAYLKGEALAFFGSHPRSADDRRAAVRRAARPLAPDVAQTLTRQNQAFGFSAAREANLAALRSGAAAVVTGQQVGLLLGPLYTLYKAATAIRVAQALSQESGHPVVPVFWLQTEDHDLAEVASYAVSYGQGETLTLQLPADPHQRVSIAHHRLPDELTQQLAALREVIVHLPHAAAHVERLERHYRPAARWSDAFAGLLAELFADEGLVIIDPRDRGFAAAITHVHRIALQQAGVIASALSERVTALDDAGYQAPIAVRAGAPLAFFHPEGAEGSRYRLGPSGPDYAEIGGSRTHTVAELTAALAADPLCFSTSALLRPILQDTLLPTAAYVGGPAEVAYFAQLAPLYEAFRMTMPLIVPRACFCVVDDRAHRLLHRWRLDPADAQRAEDDLLARCHATRGETVDSGALGQALIGPFESALEQLAPQLVAAGQGLDIAIEKTRQRVRSDIAKLVTKYDNARLHGDAVMVDEVRRVRRLLFPENKPQERVYGLSSFAPRLGERVLIERVLAAVVPYDPTLRYL